MAITTLDVQMPISPVFTGNPFVVKLTATGCVGNDPAHPNDNIAGPHMLTIECRPTPTNSYYQPDTSITRRQTYWLMKDVPFYVDLSWMLPPLVSGYMASRIDTPLETNDIYLIPEGMHGFYCAIMADSLTDTDEFGNYRIPFPFIFTSNLTAGNNITITGLRDVNWRVIRAFYGKFDYHLDPLWFWRNFLVAHEVNSQIISSTNTQTHITRYEDELCRIFIFPQHQTQVYSRTPRTGIISLGPFNIWDEDVVFGALHCWSLPTLFNEMKNNTNINEYGGLRFEFKSFDTELSIGTWNNNYCDINILPTPPGIIYKCIARFPNRFGFYENALLYGGVTYSSEWAKRKELLHYSGKEGKYIPIDDNYRRPYSSRTMPSNEVLRTSRSEKTDIITINTGPVIRDRIPLIMDMLDSVYFTVNIHNVLEGDDTSNDVNAKVICTTTKLNIHDDEVFAKGMDIKCEVLEYI